MNTRSIEEIQQSLSEANASDDADLFNVCIAELEEEGSPNSVATALRARANVLMIQGDNSAALEWLGKAMSAFEILSDRRNIASTANNIGNALSTLGKYSDALEMYHQALAVFEELNSIERITGTLNNIAIAHANIGEFASAIEYYNRSLAIYDEVGDPIGGANVLANIGNVHARMDNYSEALGLYFKALAVNEEHNVKHRIAFVLGSIGLAYDKMGDGVASLEYFTKSLSLFQEMRRMSDVARTVGNISALYYNTNNLPLALEFAERALAAHVSLGELPGIAISTSNLVSIYLELKLYSQARELLNEMEAMNIADPAVRITRVLHRASFFVVDNDLEGAIDTLNTALETAESYNLRTKQLTIHAQLREIAMKQNNLAAYVQHNNEFTRLTDEVTGTEQQRKLSVLEKRNEFERQTREHDKQLAVLHSTLPKHIADRVAKGEVVNDHFENVAVLFLDIVGFTSISSRLEPQDVVSLLDDIFSQCDSICTKHNITKIKTIGDSYMGVGFDTSELRIANAALAMMNITLKDSFAQSIAESPIRFRIGIHSGPVVAGVLGKERVQYDVWGDTVNVASRMESTSEPGRIHISEAFATLLHATSTGDSLERPLQVLERGSIDIKGKGTMKTYWLEG